MREFEELSFVSPKRYYRIILSFLPQFQFSRLSYNLDNHSLSDQKPRFFSNQLSPSLFTGKHIHTKKEAFCYRSPKCERPNHFLLDRHENNGILTDCVRPRVSIVNGPPTTKVYVNKRVRTGLKDILVPVRPVSPLPRRILADIHESSP